MPRFVLLYHECPPGYEKPSHWDFMLEAGVVLWTWELRELPAAWQSVLPQLKSSPNTIVSARRLADHRLAYLDYEGPLTNDRGSVTRQMSGDYQLLESTAQRIVVRLTAEKLQTTVELAETSQLGLWQLTIRH
jgi:hypothetical protein